jgi:hypothetical protein
MEQCSKHTHHRTICSLLRVSNWVDSLICPTGLLLVVSPTYLLAVPVSVLWVGLGKILDTNKALDVRNIFGGSHMERWWRCSYTCIQYIP